MPDRPGRQRASSSGAGGERPFREALRLQRDAAAIGFDWPDAAGVLAKLREEVDEIAAALADGDCAQARDELGDVLFTAVNMARFLDADPEDALQQANARFAQRFAALRAQFERDGRDPAASSLDEMDAVWERVKLGNDTGARAPDGGERP